jgi:type II secretory pathway component GspD/PulD (secretin)
MLWDCCNSTIRPGFAGFTPLALVSAVLVCATLSKAAETDFVGVLALAVEDEVARKINLSARARAKLLEVIDRRENEALEIVLGVRDLPLPQRAARLAPFRAESERQGLAVLTEQQRRQLRAIQVSRMGMASLGEPDVSQHLGLSPAQQKQIGQLLEERARTMANVDREKQRLARATYERKLAAVLTEDQQAGWGNLSAATLQERKGSKEAGGRQLTYPNAGPHAAAGGGLATTSPELSEQVPKVGDGRLQFSFQYAPWRTVLEWFAGQADLSLVMDAAPPGTLNYIDRRHYSPSEAIDLLNSVLLTKGYTLVRRDRMLMLINLEDGIPPNLVSQLLPDQLDDRGEFELVSCLFTLERMTPEEAEKEISRLLGPQGSIVALPTSRQILVTETAGKLRMVRKVIATAADRDAREVGTTTAIALQHASAEDVLVVARQLLGLPEDKNESPDGTLRVAADPFGSRLLVTGEPHMVSRLTDLVKVLDVPSGVDGISGAVIETPQLEVYSIATADPTSVLQVLQTLLVGMPGVRLSMDPKTGNLVALARPSQHETIRATIDQMQRDARQIEVIRLWSVDPQLAVTSINKLFGGADGEGQADPSAPRVDSDPVTRSLLIRGSQAQVAQIRTLLEKMGESDAEAQRIRAGQRGKVRMLPITGPGARRALEQAGLIWPTMRRNRVRIVTPAAAAAVRTIRPGRGMTMPPQPSIDLLPNEPPTGETQDDDTNTPHERSLKEGSDADVPAAREATSLPLTVASTTVSLGRQEHATQADGETADILVAPGPRGLVIASEDTEALDDFERLLLSLGDRAVAGQRELAVFYLKYAKAEVAAELLKPFLGAGGSDAGAGGGSLLGDLAGAALGEAGGGLIGSLLGLGGGGGTRLLSSGTLSVMADSRLNALVVQGSPAELDLAEQLLEVIDQISSPEDVQTVAKPRFIPVFNMSAQEVAVIVREIYSARIGGRGGQPQQPTPEEFLRALRGGRGGRSSTRREVEEQEQMVISVDSGSNSLIVSAPDSLFRDVQELVNRLDEMASEQTTATHIVTLRRTNPKMLQQALTAMLGNVVRTSADQERSNGKKPLPNRGQQAGRAAAPAPRPPTPEQIRAQMRQRIEFFKALQRAGQAGKDGKGRPGGRGR